MNTLVINCSPVRDGATGYIAQTVSEVLAPRSDVRSVCIGDYAFGFCRGCRSCHATARCVQQDDVDRLIAQYEWADVIVSVSPSYGADVPGQFKAFIDRCTPWCNTHEPHASIGAGKKGYVIALHTGPNMPECQRIIGTLEHFYGHMEIERCGSLALCGVENREDAKTRREEILQFCRQMEF